MAQHDYVIANGTGAAVRSDLNSALAAIVSNNSGATAPSPTYAYQLWADTTTNLLKLRNSANSAWITVGDLTAANLGLATLASPTFTGTVTIPTATISTGAGIPLASAASPAIYFTGDTNTGIYSPGADQFAITTGGSGRLFVDSSGRVGLGTSGPAYKLDVVVASNKGIGAFTPATSTITDFVTAGVGWTFTRPDGTYIHSVFSYDTAAAAKNNLAIQSRSDIVFANSGGPTTSTESMRITEAGRVGIGTTSPVEKLHVLDSGNTTIRVATSDTSGTAIGRFRAVYTGGGGGSTSAVDLRAGDGYGYLLAENNVSLLFGTNNTERARIDSSGRLLVGTSSDSKNAVTAGQRLISVTTGDDSLGGAAFTTYCGTSNPTFRSSLISLQRSRGTTDGSMTVVASGDKIGDIEFRGADGTNFVTGATIQAFVDATPGTNDMPGRLVFSTTADGASSPTERMRIDNSGNVLINRTSQIAAEKFAVYTGTSGTNTAYFWYGQTDDRANVICRHDRSTGATVGVQIAFLNQTGSNVGQISSTGSATTYTTSSDYRLKENVVPLTGAVDRLDQLQVHRFNFLADPETTVDGFIAHEVQEIVPEAIVGEKDAVNEDGSIKPQGIDQSKLVPLLTAALQEAIGRIETLEAEVAALKGA